MSSQQHNNKRTIRNTFVKTFTTISVAFIGGVFLTGGAMLPAENPPHQASPLSESSVKGFDIWEDLFGVTDDEDSTADEAENTERAETSREQLEDAHIVTPDSMPEDLQELPEGLSIITGTVTFDCADFLDTTECFGGVQELTETYDAQEDIWETVDTYEETPQTVLLNGVEVPVAWFALPWEATDPAVFGLYSTDGDAVVVDENTRTVFQTLPETFDGAMVVEKTPGGIVQIAVPFVKDATDLDVLDADLPEVEPTEEEGFPFMMFALAGVLFICMVFGFAVFSFMGGY